MKHHGFVDAKGSSLILLDDFLNLIGVQIVDDVVEIAGCHFASSVVAFGFSCAIDRVV